MLFSFLGDRPGVDSRSQSQREDLAPYPSVHVQAAGKPSLNHVLCISPWVLCSRWRTSALLLIYGALKDCFQTVFWSKKRGEVVQSIFTLLIFNVFISFLEPWLVFFPISAADAAAVQKPPLLCQPTNRTFPFFAGNCVRANSFYWIEADLEQLDQTS